MSELPAEDVVLYDIPMSASLQELYSDPQTRWFAVKKMAAASSRGESGLTAASSWNPLLHPRGRDGKFIHKFGFVRWFDFSLGKWRRGQVEEISENGDLKIAIKDKFHGPPNVTIPHVDISERVTAAPSIKADLDLPEVGDPVGGKGFSKVGGQGGSNPGGMYVVDDVSQGGVVPAEQWSAIRDSYGLATTDPADVDVLGEGILSTGDGVYLRRKGADGEFAWYAIDGEEVAITVPTTGAEWLYALDGDPNLASVESAWAEVVKAHGDFVPKAKFYIKKSKSPNHAANEVAANRMYELAGVPVADVFLGKDGVTVASKVVPETETKVDLGVAMSGSDRDAVLAAVREDMVVDAWLGNWDVVGLGLENIQVVDGVPYRIDAGGAMLYRAMGSPKGAMFGPEVGELESLRDKKINSNAAAVFGGATAADLYLGAEKVASVNPAEIISVIDSLGMDPDTADLLIARRAYIIKELGLIDPWHEDPVVDVDVPSTPTPKVGVSDSLPPELASKNLYVKEVVLALKGKPPGGTPLDVGTLFEDSHGKKETVTVGELSEWLKWFGDSATLEDFDPVDEAASILNFLGEVPEADLAGAPGIEQTKPESLSFSGYGWDSIARQWVDGLKYKPSSVYRSDMETLTEGWESPFGTKYVSLEETIIGDAYIISGAIGKTQGVYLRVVGHGTAEGDGPAFVRIPTHPGEPTGQAETFSPSAVARLIPISDASTLAQLQGSEWAARVTEAANDPSLLWEEFNPSVASMMGNPNHPRNGVIAYLYSSDELALAINSLGPSTEGSVVMDDAGNLYRIVKGTDPDSPLTVELPDGTHTGLQEGRTYYYTRLTSSKQPDPALLAEEMLEAAWQAQKMQHPEKDAPKKVDPKLVAKLDVMEEISHKADTVDVPAAGGGEYIPSAEFLAAIETAPEGFIPEELKPHVQNSLNDYFGGELPSSLTPDDVDGWLGEFRADYGLDEPTITISEVLSAHAESVAVKNAPASPFVPSVLPGVNPKLMVGDSVNFAEIPTVELAREAAQSFVGKTVLLQKADGTIPNFTSVGVSYGLSTPEGAVKGVQGIFYIDDIVESGTPGNEMIVLKGRTTTGHTVSIGAFYQGSTYKKWKISDISESVSVDDFKAMSGPTLKQDGTIVANGMVVGTWEKNNSYGMHKWTYTVFPEFTSSGESFSGGASKKTALRDYISMNVIPTAVAVGKKKKSSPKSAEVAEALSLDIPGSPTLSDGSEAKLGDWVKSTKGGGGFVGKIVGWPHQELHPGLAFAVSEDGTQKIVKLKTQKRVDGPDGVDVPPALVDGVPTAYFGMKFADGNMPKVGQRVRSGSAGTQIEGFVSHINPEKGWVYILQDDGKVKSKTFSVTEVLEQPTLIWDPEESPAAKAGLLKKSAKPGKKKPSGPSYPAADGSVLEQSQSVKDSWLEGHPKRKLTKDGYAPKVGMRVRMKDGSEATIMEMSSKYASNPNRIKVWNGTKMINTSTTTVEVDHAVELAGFQGEKPKKFSGFAQGEISSNLGLYGTPESSSIPAGTEIFAAEYMDTYSYVSGSGAYDARTSLTYKFFGVTPDGKILNLQPGVGGVNILYAYEATTFMFANSQAGNLEKVGVYDPEFGEGTLHLIAATKPSTKNGPKFITAKPSTENGSKYIPAQVQWIDDVGNEVPAADMPDISTGADDIPDAPDVPGTSADAPSIPDAPSATVAEPDPSYLNSEGGIDLNALPEMGSLPSPETPSAQALAPLTPPKTKTEVVTEAVKVLPVATDKTPDLDDVAPSLRGTKAASIKQAASRMLEVRNSTDPDTGSTYGLGDSHLVEDMLFRYHVEVDKKEERLVMRFRLREDVSEHQIDQMVVGSGSSDKGAWKEKGSQYLTDFSLGDAVAVRIGSNMQKGDGSEKMLKPVTGAQSPNARVIALPVLLGKSKSGDAEYPTYRMRVRMEDGTEGDVDIQLRPGGSVTAFEWDPNAPKATPSGNNVSAALTLTPTAEEAGWEVRGSMGMDVIEEVDSTNSQGKFIKTAGKGTSGLARGSGGKRFFREEDDGTRINFNAAHSIESGTGYSMTRRANLAGEVLISVPIDGRTEDEILASMSRGMELVGLEPEAQRAPTDEQVALLALEKFVGTYHPNYTYRASPITGPDDPRVTSTLTFMNAHLKQHLGRKVTLDDIRIHVHPSGRVQPLLSPEVGIAIAKEQGIKVHTHTGVGGDRVLNVFSGPHSGLLSTDERWSLGIGHSGQSSSPDMKNGVGDRVYIRGAADSTGFGGGYVLINPARIAMGLEQYNNANNSWDGWGERGTKNTFMTTGPNRETMVKRRIERDDIAFYVASADTEAKKWREQMKERGVTHIGGRSVDEIFLSKSAATQATKGDWFSVGMEKFADDIPITALLEGSASAEPSASTSPAAPVAASLEGLT